MKLKAFKRNLVEPYDAMYLHENKIVFHKIELVGEKETMDGLMFMVKLRHNVDLCDPSADVAALVGLIKTFHKGRHTNLGRAQRKRLPIISPLSPELWYWRDSFWAKAICSDDAVYYKSKSYLFYEVKISNENEFLSKIALP